MPELPEVETTCRGIAPHVSGLRVTDVIVRERRLRWPVTAGLHKKLTGRLVEDVSRRAKYILLNLDQGSLVIHLGMSGHLSIVDCHQPPIKHDHIDICFENRKALRFHDPRRFGAVLWTAGDPLEHKLLKNIGPEPLGDAFTGDYLFTATRNRKRCIRDTLLDGRIVAGVGNIYANEALFQAGIDPRRAAGRISKQRITRLVDAIKRVLSAAIQAGGTTLRDFRDSAGRPGYFSQQLLVYGRAGEACNACTGMLRQESVGGRSLYFCPRCQK